MTIDEAIIHCEEVAIRNFKNENNAKCVQCGEEHVQLAKWLKELKDYKSREDVVPVVRKPVKEYEGRNWCGLNETDFDPDDFCSYGEKKE